jgi:hypothetical protein
MPAFKDRVQDTTTTTGTGNITLSGTAPSGKVDFNTAFGTTQRFYYTIQGQSGSEWETGEGYLSASTTLVRDRVIASSNSGSAVNFSAGTKDVFCDAIAESFNAQPGVMMMLRAAMF